MGPCEVNELSESDARPRALSERDGLPKASRHRESKGGPSTVDRLRSDRGSPLVEFAITGLLFFALIFAIFEASRAIYHYNIIASVAREGTRFAAVRGSESGREASRADIQAFVRGRALGLDPTVDVNWSPANDPGAIIEVRVRHTFTTIVPLAGVPNMNMSSTARSIMVR